MSNETHLDTPLAGLGETGFQHGNPDTVLLAEQPFVGFVNLRGDPQSAAFTEAVRSVIGVAPPLQPNTVAQGSNACIMWLAPDEWLIRTLPDAAPEAAQSGSAGADLAHQIEAALGEEFSAVTDQTSGFSVIHLTGPHARDVLSKGCPLDLHPRVFGIGQCAQSHYFKTTVLLRRIEADRAEAWEVIVRRSFADYTARIMMDAMEEYL
ncbi:MAG: sarcosine oxidase subunit gamma [Alcaligenaceae bacterium]|nr:sarcosine oxidase subunit gamma [Alcaligenaceae bacterium]